MKAKKWLALFVTVVIAGMLLCAGLVAIIDPFFHYHRPLGFLEYPLSDERYQNDGLQRQWDYTILITGTSEAQNFNASTVQRLWGSETIKTCYSGATLHELGKSIRNAKRHNPDLKLVICSLDANNLEKGADEDGYTGLPEYLFDENPFNDVAYLLNGEVIRKSLSVLNYTRIGRKTPSFDEYGRFDGYREAGREAVLRSYDRSNFQKYEVSFGETEKNRIRENLEQNVIEVANANPDVEFIFFIPPYCYCYFDALERTGQLEYAMDSMKYAAGLLVGLENVEVYSFFDCLEITTDLDHYSDTLHYDGAVCDVLCGKMHEKSGLLTKENYEAYFEALLKTYQEYDYSDLY
ncbi:MAG: hypothetical protein J5546_03025 [Lachnospiraceae bacterium]|nr:hypothetical protein [Lachnospiraceae bacterium]